jgi:hypothetical protein
MNIDEARGDLQRAAMAYSADQRLGNERQLEQAARDFAKACIDAATGVTAAGFQLAAEQKRGVRLCPSCMKVKVVWAHDGRGAGRFVDPKTHQPHWCKR